MFAMQKIIPGFTVSNPVNRKKGNVTDMAKKNTYDAGSISVLEGLEAVRKRPGMYIGSVSRKGLNHLIYEIVDNAVDEHLAGYCSLIHVILEKDGSCTVTDNGRGIPVDMHEKGVSAERLVFTTLHAGGKFDNSAYKTSGGLHGVGSSVVNALSTYLDIKISRDGYVHHDHYERGIPTIELEEGLLPKLGKTRQTGTSINFLPDPEIFEKTRFSATEVKSRLHETAYLNPELTIRFEDKRGAEVEDITYHEPDGIIGFIKDLNHSAEVLHDPVYLKGEADGIQVEVAFQFTNEFRENVLGFCSNIYNAEGGTHLTGFKTTFTTVMNTYAREIGVLKDKDPNFTGADIRNGMTAVVSIKHPEPRFEAQTKTKLDNQDASRATGKLVGEQMVKDYPDGADIAILDFPSNESCVDRVNGFLDGLGDNKDKFNIVAQQDGEAALDASMSLAEDIITANTDLQAFFCINDPSALGAAAAVKAANKTGKIGVYSIDASPDGKQALIDGEFTAVACQVPVQIAEYAFNAAQKYVGGDTTIDEKKVYLDSHLVLKDEAEKTVNDWQ